MCWCWTGSSLQGKTNKPISSISCHTQYVLTPFGEERWRTLLMFFLLNQLLPLSHSFLAWRDIYVLYQNSGETSCLYMFLSLNNYEYFVLFFSLRELLVGLFKSRSKWCYPWRCEHLFALLQPWRPTSWFGWILELDLPILAQQFVYVISRSFKFPWLIYWRLG